MPFVRGARAAMGFLTRVPVGSFPYTKREWRWASAHFPLVGLLLGAVHAAIFYAVSRAGSLVAAAVVVAASLLLTGAFHEDGLADTADALGGGYTRERVLEILKDSRVGAFGAAALVVALVLRVALLARLDACAPAAMIVTQCASRVPPIVLMVAMPYAQQDAVSRSKLVRRAGAAQAAVAIAVGVAAVVTATLVRAISPTGALGVGAASAVVTAVCGWRFHVRVGGVTGDFLGATQQVSECAMLLALALDHG
jgi:adenosylcobinamide-GDP ribazoletransferase